MRHSSSRPAALAARPPRAGRRLARSGTPARYGAPPEGHDGTASHCLPGPPWGALLAALAGLLVAACERPSADGATPTRDEASDPSARAPTPAAPAVVGALAPPLQPHPGSTPQATVLATRLASSAAFDVTLGPEGPIVVWATSGAEPTIEARAVEGHSAGARPSSTFTVARLRALARPAARSLGQQQPAPPPDADAGAPSPTSEPLELVTAHSAGRLAVAWTAPSGGDTLAVAVCGQLAERRFGAPAVLGRVAASPDVARGDLALRAGAASAHGTGPEPRFLVLRRSVRGSCEGGRGALCTGFAFHELSEGAARPWGFPLSIPEPCRLGVVGLASLDHRSHYAVCALSDGRPTTTLFSIAFEPEYARADPVLAGCEPRGVTALGARVWVTASCATGPRAALLADVMTGPREQPLAAVELRCVGPRLLAGADDTAAPTQPLELDRAEPLLPAALATATARAVVSRGVLFVADTASGRLELTRHACRAGRLSSL